MQEYLINNPWLLLVVAWTLVWKGLALWRAARAGQKIWYVVLLVINTVGILEIIYLLITNKPKAKPAALPSQPVAPPQQ
jgi:hypothetical protein